MSHVLEIESGHEPVISLSNYTKRLTTNRAWQGVGPGMSLGHSGAWQSLTSSNIVRLRQTPGVVVVAVYAIVVSCRPGGDPFEIAGIPQPILCQRSKSEVEIKKTGLHYFCINCSGRRVWHARACRHACACVCEKERLKIVCSWRRRGGRVWLYFHAYPHTHP